MRRGEYVTLEDIESDLDREADEPRIQWLRIGPVFGYQGRLQMGLGIDRLPCPHLDGYNLCGSINEFSPCK
jgi:hypothetical protein